MKELGITKDPQEYLQEWEKQNNPFYPNEMRWDRVKVNTFLKDWKQQCNIQPSELLERYNEAIEAIKGIERECDNQNNSHENIWRIAYGLLKKQEQTISKSKGL